MKKLLSIFALFLSLVIVGCSDGKTTWTVTTPWAASGVASVVSQKAASLSTKLSENIILVAEAIPGDTATMNSWIKSNNAESDSLMFVGEGVLSITANLDSSKLQFNYSDLSFIQNLYSSIFVMSANAKLGIKSIEDLISYMEAGNKITVAANGSVGSEAFLAAALFGSIGYGDKIKIVAYTSAAESAQAVSRGETDFAISHQSQILESYKQNAVNMVCAFDKDAIQTGPFKGLEGVGKYDLPYFKNVCGIVAVAGTDATRISELNSLYGKILEDPEFASWLTDSMLLEIDPLTNEEMEEHLHKVADIVEQYKHLVLN